MENIYNKMKKGLQTVAVVGALALGSYTSTVEGSNLIYDSTRNSISQARTEYNKEERKVVDDLNKCLSDGRFSLNEQEDMLSETDTIIKYSSEKGITVSKDIKELQGGLEKNLNSFDYGKPELQKMIEKDGLNVGVDHNYTRSEYILDLIVGSVLIIRGYTYVDSKL